MTRRRLLSLAVLAAGLGLARPRASRRGGTERNWPAPTAKWPRAGTRRRSARLERLSARWPGRAEVEYPLGVCEAALGHVDAALAAWERVPRDSALGPRAILDRARLALDHGRLAIAEASVALLLMDRGELGEQASRLADQIDLYTGRQRAISRRIERRWPVSPDQAGLLRLHWQLDSQPSPILAIRETLDRMARQAPEDDRVWLGRADLATGIGRYDVADELLRKCEARRPDDPDVVQARLNWALDAGRPDEAARAASRLPAFRVSSRRGRRGDRPARRPARRRRRRTRRRWIAGSSSSPATRRPGIAWPSWRRATGRPTARPATAAARPRSTAPPTYTAC